MRNRSGEHSESREEFVPGNGISRRHFLASVGVVAATACLSPRALPGENEGLVEKALKEGVSAKISVQKLRGNISVMTGSGGNVAVLPGRDGKLLVDTGFVTSQPQIREALASISSDPIKQLINTHWHFDHASGNAWLHESGAAILAQENTRKHLSLDTRVEGWSYTFLAAAPGGIPSTVFKEEETVHFSGRALALKHYLPAHTDSDISVHFLDADVIHVGDTFWNGSYPFIDYSTGGSIEGTIRAAEANLAAITPKMIVIPGHGPIGNREQLVVFRDVMVEVRDKVSLLKKQGRTLAEVIAAKPGARYDAEWGELFMPPASFLSLVYQGV